MNNKRYFKTEDEIFNDIKEDLINNGFTDHKGSIAMLFAKIIAKTICAGYILLEKLHLNCFLSSADREHLTYMAEERGIPVSDKYSDDKLRYLIASDKLLNNSCSKESIKSNILVNVPEVYDVKFKDFVEGVGSCGVFIFCKNQTDTTLENCKIHSLKAIPAGTKIYYTYPEKKELLLKIAVSSVTRTLTEEVELKGKIITELNNVLSNLNVDGIVIYELISIIRNVSTKITDIKILESSINGEKTTLTRLSSDIEYVYSLSNKTEIIIN